MPQVRLELDEYTLRSIDACKGIMGLKNRSDVISVLAKEKAQLFVAPKINAMMLKELDKTYNKQKANSNQKGMTDEKLRSLLGLK
jgi:predicted transcriptional regulator